MIKKKVIKNQKYEDYWKITLEYSDFTGISFNYVLSLIVSYIDRLPSNSVGLTSEDYKKMQQDIETILSKSDSASTRKSINQMFKLGFINNRGKSYHYLTKKFLDTKDVQEKRMLFSKIVYDNSAFLRSFSNDSNVNQISFLINTLEEVGKISKDELLAIMCCNVNNYPKGFLSAEELKSKLNEIKDNKMNERKYNQRNYLFNICKNLTGVFEKKHYLTLNPDLIVDADEKVRSGRSTYLQRLYKIQLINEEKDLYKYEKGKCVLEGKAYPILIASHIKPYRDCKVEEQFDKDNGLLLSKNMDSLFDQGYITFNEDGSVLTSSKLDSDVSEYVKTFRLDEKIFNSRRHKFMEYHRKNVFIK